MKENRRSNYLACGGTCRLVLITNESTEQPQSIPLVTAAKYSSLPTDGRGPGSMRRDARAQPKFGHKGDGAVCLIIMNGSYILCYKVIKKS